MKSVLIVAMFACVSCVALPDVPEPPTEEAPTDDNAEQHTFPPCVAMSEKIHRVYYKACAEWSDFPIASVCYVEPDERSCWKFDSKQRYDSLYCCCDSSFGNGRNPFH